ncbi:acyltransferase family protein [Chthonobacter albigriseus]|uniref:acyltransferase family protein n=1 Tax=Chthonobacter albigriseus TaxID=1683161 RepID=UPI0015EFD767|nr:acyltransferase family protein [Chthonobacter albigriseus]
MAQASRVDWVDAAKGLCIVFVVMMHSTLGVQEAAGETGWLGTVVAFAAPFRMPDFFLISGLFLSRVVGRDWRTFTDRRIIHFFYFYVLWMTIQFAFKFDSIQAHYPDRSLISLYLESLFLQPFGTLWFIWILPFFALTVRLTRQVPVPVMLAIAAVLEMLPIHTGWMAIDEFASRFVYFYSGYALAPVIFRLADAAAGRPLAAAAALLVWGFVNGWAVFAGYSTLPGLSLALGYAGAVAIVMASVLIGMTPKLGDVARHVGSQSIVVYLAFFLPMVVTRTVLLKAGVIDDIGTISAIVTVTSVVVPFIIHFVAMRTGMTFLFERPRWARIERPETATRPASTAVA